MERDEGREGGREEDELVAACGETAFTPPPSGAGRRALRIDGAGERLIAMEEDEDGAVCVPED